jgi:taurine dioxygenase
MLDLTPLTPTIGAEVTNVDLSVPLSDECRAAIEAALVQWKALFFRNQTIDDEKQAAFARNFGPLLADNYTHMPHAGGVSTLIYEQGDPRSPRTDIWYNDRSYLDIATAKYIILRAVELPSAGGDTLFADMALAYERLSPAIKAALEGLNAVHDGFPISSSRIPPDQWAQRRDTMRNIFPVVRTFPANDRKLVYVNATFTTEIQELPRSESKLLLDFLNGLPAEPENHCRFRWEPGSVAIWDNRCTQHYLVHDFWPERRVMARTMVSGNWTD